MTIIEWKKCEKTNYKISFMCTCKWLSVLNIDIKSITYEFVKFKVEQNVSLLTFYLMRNLRIIANMRLLVSLRNRDLPRNWLKVVRLERPGSGQSPPAIDDFLTNRFNITMN